MKTNFCKLASVFAMSIAMFVSCQEQVPIDPDPIFPETVLTKTVVAGESVEINIEPNLAWEVKISGEGSGNFFWIDDDGMKETSVSGKVAGPAVITVKFSDDNEFDVNRVCDVTLTMAGQSKKIATITRPSLGRTFELTLAVAGENGYTDEYASAEKAELKAFQGSVEYTVPVRVVTNYAWDLALPSTLKATSLDGKEVVAAGNAGTTDLLLTAILSQDIINGKETFVKFIDKSNTDVVEELPVTIPPVLDRIEYSLTTTLTFNNAGDVMANGGNYIEGVPAVLDLLSTSGTTVRVVEWFEKGGYHGISFADWANVKSTRYDQFTDNDVLAKYNIEISVTENTTYEVRQADVFIIPASKADVPFEQWTDPGTGKIKAEYLEYVIGRISQEGLEKDYITLSDNPDDVYKATFTKYTEEQWWAKGLGTSNIYELIYSDQYSDAVLLFDYAFTSYKIYDYDFKEVAEDKLSSFWLTFTGFSNNEKGRASMYPEKFDVASAPYPESFILLYDSNGKVIAGIACRFTSEGPSTDNAISLASGTAEITKLSADTEMYQVINGNFSTTEIYQVVTGDKNISLNSTLEIWDFFAMNPANWTDYNPSPITMEPANPNLFFSADRLTEKTEVVFILKGGNGMNIGAIYYVYDPSIGVAAPFSFQYPEMVTGATLEKYTGDPGYFMSECYGVTEDMIYELKYTSSTPNMAMLNVPSMPAFDEPWNGSKWLTFEVMGENVIYIDMNASEPSQDFYAFKNPDGYTYKAVLICTYAPGE